MPSPRLVGEFSTWGLAQVTAAVAKALQAKLRPLTRRTHGRSLGEIIARVNPRLRGWYGYFQESYPTGRSGPDGWRRLRAFLRQREKRPG